jgi:hypothetical protein
MNPTTESSSPPRVRAMPIWIRVVVWVAIAFLSASVIAGMFLY